MFQSWLVGCDGKLDFGIGYQNVFFILCVWKIFLYELLNIVVYDFGDVLLRGIGFQKFFS